MKNIFFAMLALMTTVYSFGQPPQRYDTCSVISQYAGEWRYTNGNDTIRIYFQAYRFYSPEIRFVGERLIGWHEYKQGNTIIESDYQRRFSNMIYNRDNDTTMFSIILRLEQCSNSCLELRGTINDLSQSNESKDVIALLDPTKTNMNWTQKHGESTGIITGAHGMTLPSQFTLTKQ